MVRKFRRLFVKQNSSVLFYKQKRMKSARNFSLHTYTFTTYRSKCISSGAMCVNKMNEDAIFECVSKLASKRGKKLLAHFTANQIAAF